MMKSTRLRLEMNGYREVITGRNLDITDCTPAMYEAYEEGKRKAREDMQKRIDGPFNRNPRFSHLKVVDP